ncbi:MAG: FlgD immunoglobulin-like domain containing protein [bacterium]
MNCPFNLDSVYAVVSLKGDSTKNDSTVAAMSIKQDSTFSLTVRDSGLYKVSLYFQEYHAGPYRIFPGVYDSLIIGDTSIIDTISSLDFQFTPVSCTISGNIRLGKNQPEPMWSMLRVAAVDSLSKPGLWFTHTQPDSNGNFSLNVAPGGLYQLIAWFELDSMPFTNGFSVIPTNFAYSDTFELNSGTSLSGLNCSVKYIIAPDTLSGKVDLGGTSAGSILVQLSYQNGQHVGTTQTDNRGQFAFKPLANGLYSLKILDTVNQYEQTRFDSIVLNNQNIDSISFTSIPTSLLSRRAIPLETRFFPNCPNPFNLGTQMNFIIGQRNSQLPYVTLKIHDLQGRLVRNLVHDRLKPGFYSVIWDGLDSHGSTVCTGTYVVRMQAGQFIDQYRIILVK